jgi:hypothetical protein
MVQRIETTETALPNRYATRAAADTAYYWSIENFGGDWTVDKKGKEWVLTQLHTKSEKLEDEAKFALSLSWWEGTCGEARRELAVNTAVLAKFTERLAADPFEAFRLGGNDVVMAAAKVSLLKRMINAHNRGMDDETICRDVERQRDRWVNHESLNHPSSLMENLTERATRIAAVAYAGQLRTHIDMHNEAIGNLYTIAEANLP